MQDTQKNKKLRIIAKEICETLASNELSVSDAKTVIDEVNARILSATRINLDFKGPHWDEK